MKKTILLLLLLVAALHLAAQQAGFYADTTLLRKYAGSGAAFERALEMQLIINGQSLAWGGSPVKITPGKQKLDTIFYKRDKKSAWDTIICNITQPHKYNFVYNSCCGGFNLQNATLNIMPKGKVRFEQQAKSPDNYLGKLGETGTLLRKTNNDTITPLCRSAMSPNIYWVSIEKIELCKDGTGCEENEMFCLYNKNEAAADYSFTYKVKGTIVKFLYMPLDESVLTIKFDANKGISLE